MMNKFCWKPTEELLLGNYRGRPIRRVMGKSLLPSSTPDGKVEDEENSFTLITDLHDASGGVALFFNMPPDKGK